MSILREALLGGWELSSFESRGSARLDAGEAKLGPRHEPLDTVTGAVSYPLGTAPRGLILYTADGYMSAQLTGSADAAVAAYIAYGGRFRVDEDTATVHHEVSVSMLPELLASPQPRQARVDGDRLTLSATSTNDGVTTLNTLVWVRRR
ncbi:lipocalin-like domain-containing protein [Mycobacterium sp. SVM_VP21]|nr:lipocalin-like domain-containing protein [Mycobacterium sp. SVM_VP21]